MHMAEFQWPSNSWGLYNCCVPMGVNHLSGTLLTTSRLWQNHTASSWKKNSGRTTNLNEKFLKYFKEYEMSNILAMIRNNKAEPRICTEDFHGRNVLVTGATSGIGYYTARKYASHGANLLCINRSEEKSQNLRREIEKEFAVTCNYELADFSRLDDTYAIGRKLQASGTSFDVIIHNAGVFNTKRKLTADRLEMVFVVNYLSSFILNYLLMDTLKREGKARILLVNSEGHRFEPWGLKLDDLNWDRRFYTGLRSYGSAKLAQLLSVLIFEDRFKRSGVTINAVHPGAVRSQSGKDNGPVYQWFKRNFIEKNLRSPEIAAEALYYLGVSKELEGSSGGFYNLTTKEVPAPPALDREVAEELWDLSLRLGRVL